MDFGFVNYIQTYKNVNTATFCSKCIDKYTKCVIISTWEVIKTFDDRLKNLRNAKGVKQADVAKALGIGKSAYSNYEKDLREPNAVILKAMSQYFGVTIDYLLDCHTDFATSDAERKHIKKYRVLDEHGKKMVDFVTDTEYERMCEQKNTDTHSDYTQSIAAGEGSQGFKKTKVVGKFADQVAEIEETAEDDPERPLSICRK